MPDPAGRRSSAAGALRAQLDDLDLRIARARSVPISQWTGRAEAARSTYSAHTLFARLESVGAPFPLPTHRHALDPALVEQVVDRILQPIERASHAQRAWLDSAPSRSEIDQRLAGRRTTQTGQGVRVVADRAGVVRALAEIQRKAAQAPDAPARLGGGLTVAAVGVLTLWAALALLRRPTHWLVPVAPMLFAGVLLMTALSLGALPLRSIAVRHLDSAGGLMWWPMVAALAGVALMVFARWDSMGGPLLLSFRDRRGVVAGVVMIAAAAAVVPLASKLDSIRSELWLGLALVSLGVFAARNALTIAVTDAPTSFGSSLVIGTGFVVALLCLIHSDLGTLVLTAGLMAAWLVLFGRARWAIACVVLAAGVAFWWAGQLKDLRPKPEQVATSAEDQAAAGRCAAYWIDKLPGRERFHAACNVLVSQRSDVARSLWLARAGVQERWHGIGLVDLHVEGRATTRDADRLVLQLPMDYVASPMVAAFGWPGLAGLWLYGLVMLLLGVRALRALQVAGRTPSQHLLAGVAGFGLIAVALRTFITLGGALSGVPLTGQPAPMLAFGNAAGLAAGLYFGLALASQPRVASSNASTGTEG
ncbi:MAG: hypothetical protein ABL900_07190 [Burkholderiaceae bacterium]